jgi:hypothetical protein
VEPNAPTEPTAEPNEHDWEQANRLAKWMRLAIVPLVLVLAAILLLGRGDAVAGKPVKTESGETSQGRGFQLRLDADGRPTSFSTELVATCPSGRQVVMPWLSDDGDGVRFRRDGDRLRVDERAALWQLGLDARREGGVLKGTLDVVVRVRPKTKDPFDCVAKGIAFSVRD